MKIQFNLSWKIRIKDFRYLKRSWMIKTAVIQWYPLINNWKRSYFMYKLICQKPVLFWSAQITLLTGFLQAFIVLGMYNFGTHYKALIWLKQQHHIGPLCCFKLIRAIMSEWIYWGPFINLSTWDFFPTLSYIAGCPCWNNDPLRRLESSATID